MKLIALIDDDEVIEKILRHLKLWPEEAEPACLSRAPPSIPPPDGSERVVELCFDDPFPDYPVTTLSRGTGLTWRHRACDGVRERPALRGVTGPLRTGAEWGWIALNLPS